MIRAFLALPLPESIVHQLTVAQHRLPLPRPTPSENFHVTLVFLDSQPEPVLEDLHHAIETMTLYPPLLRLDGLGTFGGQEPDLLYARIAGDARLAAVQKKLAQAARDAGIPLKARKFVPHVTLGRFRPGEAQPETLARAMGKVEPLSSDPWQAESLVMYRSTIRHDGAVYDAMAEYPLTS